MAGRSLIAIQLHRDAFNKPWGFRLQGGVENGQPLTVQRVFMGSPSEGIIHRGDMVIRINDFDAQRMQLRDADQLINNTALTLRLEVQRNNLAPTSPLPGGQPQQQQQQQQPQPAWYGSPTMQLIHQPQVARHEPRWNQEEAAAAAPGIRHLVDSEKSKKSHVLDYTVPLPNLDHLSVTNQTYRSNQLIAPGPKAKHFRPMGSYLDASFGRGNRPEPRVLHDSQYAGNVNTRSFNRGQQRPKSVYDLSQYGGNPNTLSPYSPGGTNGFQRQGSVSPSPRSGGQPNWGQQQPQETVRVLGGRQWPPPPVVDSPPPIYAPANPFNFGNANGYQQPQQQQQYQPQYQQQYSQQQPQSPQLPFSIPATGQGNKRIVHLQFNSPAGLYSAKNAADMFTGQTGLRPNMVSGKGAPITDFKMSPTYQALMDDQSRRGTGTAWGHAPRQSRAVSALDQSGGSDL